MRYEKSQGNHVRFAKASSKSYCTFRDCHSAVRSTQIAKLQQVTYLCIESDSCLLDRALFLIVGICYRTLGFSSALFLFLKCFLKCYVCFLPLYTVLVRWFVLHRYNDRDAFLNALYWVTHFSLRTANSIVLRSHVAVRKKCFVKPEPLSVLPFEDILSNPAGGLDYFRSLVLSIHLRNKIHFNYVDFPLVVTINNK
jgi:hypothetical protein